MAKWHCGMWRPRCPKTARSNQSASKITASSVVYYVSVEFDEFVLKNDPIRRPKFGTSKKMLYLCREWLKDGSFRKWRGRLAQTHSPTLPYNQPFQIQGQDLRNQRRTKQLSSFQFNQEITTIVNTFSELTQRCQPLKSFFFAKLQ